MWLADGDQCKDSLKRNGQDDCQYVHDEILSYLAGLTEEYPQI